MNRLISMMLGAAGLLALGGCASTVYLDMVRKEPDERPSVVTDDFCKERWVQPCFAVTTMDFSAFGRVSENAAGKGGHMGSPFWLPVVFLDVPFSLCTDVVTMPWQIARYRRFTNSEKPDLDGDVPPEDTTGGSSWVEELLRDLRTRQQPDGCISDIGPVGGLANTALTVLALLRHGDSPCCKAEFHGEMHRKGLDYLVSCADTSGTTIRFKGEESDVRALFIVADALVSEYGYTRNPNLHEIAEKCAARVAVEVASVGSDTVIDEKTAGKLRWAVMTLWNAKWAGLSVADLDTRLESARALLSRHGKGDNGYYDLWEMHRKYVNGTADFKAWTALHEARGDAVLKSLLVGGTVQDKEGKWRWRSTAHPREGGIAESGLGYIADTALAVLQLEWGCSTLPARSNVIMGVKE